MQQGMFLSLVKEVGLDKAKNQEVFLFQSKCA